MYTGCFKKSKHKETHLGLYDGAQHWQGDINGWENGMYTVRLNKCI